MMANTVCCMFAPRDMLKPVGVESSGERGGRQWWGWTENPTSLELRRASGGQRTEVGKGKSGAESINPEREF
jgi:hypothetical protein